MATCNYVCGLENKRFFFFFYIALITSIMFLSLSIAIIYIITTFHKLQHFFTILRSIGS